MPLAFIVVRCLSIQNAHLSPIPYNFVQCNL